MAVLKKYDLTGREVGEVKLEDKLMEATANAQMIKDYLVAIRANARQWSANTKGRAEVSHSGQKPHPQKGTGRARQGYLGAPQYKGGGRVHGPKPKFDQHVSINRKEKRAAIRQLLIEKILGNQLHVLQFEELKKPQTKQVASFLRACKLGTKRVLFLGEGAVSGGKKTKKEVGPAEKYDTFLKSMRNIPKTEFKLVPNASGYDIALSHNVVIMDTAIDELMFILGGKS